jgi:hypothetical protein
VSKVGFKMDSILHVVLEQLKELRKDIRANQENVKTEMSISQDKLVNCQELKKGFILWPGRPKKLNK